jgi:beta-N-acetylhexosaminidase
VPFRAGIRAGLPSVMVGHIDVRAVDPGVPSSLSRPVVSGLLRGRLGFEGLVVTDALNMGAVTRTHDSARSAVAALNAGVDVLLMPPSPQQARDGIVRAVESGRLPSQRLDQAATRHVALLMHQRAQRRQVRAPGASWAESARWSASALTSVSGPCSGRLVGDRVKVTGDPAAVATFRTLGQDAGLRFGKKGTTVRLLGHGDGPARGDVVVALADPYVLGASRARVRLATYGSTPGAVAALLDVLLGNATAPGRLPVPVVGVPRSGC